MKDKMIILIMSVFLQIWITSGCGDAPNVTLNCHDDGSAHVNWAPPAQCYPFDCKAHWICKDAVNTSNIQRNETGLWCTRDWNFSTTWDYYFCNVSVFYEYFNHEASFNEKSPTTIKSCENFIPCPSLSKPSNGIINCSLGDDESPSYENTCGFTCNTGYELTGSNTRTCQSNGSWNGNNAVCNRVSCLSLSKPSNGIINCSLGDDESPSYEDSCSFTCNTGYILNGSKSRTCQSDGSWSGSISMCSKVPAPIVSVTATSNNPVIGESFSIECNVTVAKGFIGNVEIIWVVNGTVKRRVTDTVAIFDSQFVLHRDVYSMPPLHASNNNTVYCCKAVINAGEQLESNSSITLTIVADVISTKMITVSPTSTNVITLTPDSKHKDCSLDHATIIISSIAAVIFVMITAFFIGYCAYKILIRRRNKLNFTRQKDDNTAESTI